MAEIDRRRRILWIGDGGVATGFARVNHSIYNNLPKGKYDIHHLAINYKGDPYPDAKAMLYPAFLGGDVYGIGRLKSMVEKIKPDLIFILNDVWVISMYLEHLPDEYKGKVIAYFPADARPFDKLWCENLVSCTIPVAYTKFGMEAITDVIPEAHVRTIPHGIDTDTFYPMDREEARKKLNNMDDDMFVVLNANRNQPRKRVDLTIKGFAKFAKGKPSNVRLYLHMGVEDAGWHVIHMCDRLGVADRLLLTTLDLSPANSVSDTVMNYIYNATDVGLNTSTGEGWGLPTFEHGACRRAQIVPHSSACREIYTDDMVRFIPIDHYNTNPIILTEAAVVNEDDVADALEFYYKHGDIREEHADRLYNYVTSQRFNWKNIAATWDSLFEEVLDGIRDNVAEQHETDN